MKYFDSIVNPIAEARLSDGYSLKRLGKRLGMSAQYISSAEHGRYSDLNKELVTYVGDILSLPPQSVMHRYLNFQAESRRRTANKLKPRTLSRGNSLAPGHELFTAWRGMYWTSPVAFSNAFCVHPEVVATYEDGIRKSIPDQVKAALNSVNLIDPNWSEGPAVKGSVKGSVFGPAFKSQITRQREYGEHDGKMSPEIVIPLPGQRSQEPF